MVDYWVCVFLFPLVWHSGRRNFPTLRLLLFFLCFSPSDRRTAEAVSLVSAVSLDSLPIAPFSMPTHCAPPSLPPSIPPCYHALTTPPPPPLSLAGDKIGLKRAPSAFARGVDVIYHPRVKEGYSDIFTVTVKQYLTGILPLLIDFIQGSPSGRIFPSCLTAFGKYPAFKYQP